MKYLYDKVQRKIEELMRESPMKEIDMEMLKKKLPNSIRLTRYDVLTVVRELEKDGKLVIGKRKGGV